MNSTLSKKYTHLQNIIKDYGSLAVGFSGGVDSTLLLKVAHDVLGDKALGVTIQASIVPPREIDEAKAFCEAEGIRHIIKHVDPLKLDRFANNPPDRCYLCKKNNFSLIIETAKENDIDVVADGSNIDDLGDYRPGLQAISELHVKSPFREAGLTKQDIRDISKLLNLPTWNKPSYACLSSRFAYGEHITNEKLHMVDRAEQFLIDLGYPQMRVRIHGDKTLIARIELPPERITEILSYREQIVDKFKALGFDYVTLDLSGYKMGSMNAALDTTKNHDEQ